MHHADGGAGSALVTAACGVGDILRVTPLVRPLSRFGYAVDVSVAPDYAETAALLEGAPKIRRLFVYENFRATKGRLPLPALAGRRYDLAAFTVWSAPLRRWVEARRAFEFDQREWLREGDAASVGRIARSLGWEGTTPEPFAVAFGRRFDLPGGTVALHPGCKADWPWKKWHGFAALARLFPSVAVVGTDADLRNEATYFKEEFDWPAHARSFVGRLDLRDTAALLGQCAALVSNDSGLMHLGVAVGTPTFGVFGITSPEREASRSPKMFAVSKGLACEAACRGEAWGRRDCRHHLECLKTLTAEEVHARVTRQLPALANVAAVAATTHPPVSRPRAATVAAAREVGVPRPAVAAGRACGGDDVEELSVAYYGYAFDASGYGHAARAYIHALHTAGVRLSVEPTAELFRGWGVVREVLPGGARGYTHLVPAVPPFYWPRFARLYAGEGRGARRAPCGGRPTRSSTPTSRSTT